MENKNEHENFMTWNSHEISIKQTFNAFRRDEVLVDCTLSAEGQSLKAHKVVLGTCSLYFEKYFTKCGNNGHMEIIFLNMKFKDLKLVVDYMYSGHVNIIAVSELFNFCETARFLQIKGFPMVNTTELREGIVETNGNVPLPEPEIQHSLSQDLNNTHSIHVQVPKPDPEQLSVVPLPQSNSETQNFTVKEELTNTAQKKRTLEDININDSFIVKNPYALMNHMHDASMMPKEESKEDLFESKPFYLANQIRKTIDLTLDEDDNMLETKENSCSREDSYFESIGKNNNAGRDYSFAVPSTSNEVFVNGQETVNNPENLTKRTEASKVSPSTSEAPRNLCPNSNFKKVFNRQRTNELTLHVENDCERIYICDGCRKIFGYLASYSSHKKQCRYQKAFKKHIRQQEEKEEKRESLTLQSTPRLNLHSEDDDIGIIVQSTTGYTLLID